MKIERLNRYTTLPVLLDLLKRKKLVLLDPSTWDDKNDSEIIREYAKRNKAPKIFAICFSYGLETIHHWKTYADGISGCCIEFDATALIKILEKYKGIRHGKVIYKKLWEIEETSKIQTRRIPFTKRWPYRCEEEYRVLWEGDTSSTTFEIDIPLNIIRKVTINQNMPNQVYESIKKLLKNETNSVNRVNRSTLYENKRWINCFK